MNTALRILGRHFGLLLALGLPGGVIAADAPAPPRLAGPRVVLPKHEAKVVAFAPGGRVMLTDGDSGGCLRDVATGRVLRRLAGDPGADGSTAVRQITYPRFTPDGRRLVVQVGGPRFDDPNHRVNVVSLLVFDVATGRQEVRFDRVGADRLFGTYLPPPDYALSADGSVLAFCRRIDPFERRITTLDLATGELIAEFPGWSPLALSPDGGLIAFTEIEPDRTPPGQANPNRLHDRTQSPALRRIRPSRPVAAPVDRVAPFPGLGVGPMAFSNDGRKVATIAPTGALVVIAVPPDLTATPWLWNRDGKATISPHTHPFFYNPLGLRFSPDARLMYVGQDGPSNNSRGTTVWDVSGATPTQILRALAVRVATGAEVAVTFELDIENLGTFNKSGSSKVKLVDLPNLEPHLVLPNIGGFIAAISPDGRRLALLADRVVRDQPDPLNRDFARICDLAGVGAFARSEHRTALQIHDTTTGGPVATIDMTGREGHLPEVEFTPDGKSLVFWTTPDGFPDRSSEHPRVDWSVELWDVPRDIPLR